MEFVAEKFAFSANLRQNVKTVFPANLAQFIASDVSCLFSREDPGQCGEETAQRRERQATSGAAAVQGTNSVRCHFLSFHQLSKIFPMIK